LYVDDKENLPKASNMYLKKLVKEIVSVRINGVIFKLQNLKTMHNRSYYIDIEGNLYIQLNWKRLNQRLYGGWREGIDRFKGKSVAFGTK
jgi:hypothetical protein